MFSSLSSLLVVMISLLSDSNCPRISWVYFSKRLYLVCKFSKDFSFSLILALSWYTSVTFDEISFSLRFSLSKNYWFSIWSSLTLAFRVFSEAYLSLSFLLRESISASNSFRVSFYLDRTLLKLASFSWELTTFSLTWE